MVKRLRQLWQRLMNWLQRWFRQQHQPQASITLPPLSDTDFETIYFELLNGVARGWNDTQAQRFLSNLGDRAPMEAWLDWLHRFGDRHLAAATVRESLARHMLNMSLVDCGELSRVSKHLGTQLLAKSIAPPGATLPRTAEDWLQLANQQMAKQDPSGASVLYEEAIALAENSVEAITNYGVACFQLGEYRMAIDAFDRALRLQRNNVQLFLNRGLALSFLEEHQEAASDFKSVAELAPDEYTGWHNWGLSLEKLHRYEDALYCYDEAIERQPQASYTWWQKGMVLAHLDRLEEALLAFDRTLELEPNMGEAWEQKGMTLGKLQRYEEANVTLQQAAQLLPNSYNVRYQQGKCLKQLERYEEAIAAFEVALAIAPEKEDTQFQLQNAQRLLRSQQQSASQ